MISRDSQSRGFRRTWLTLGLVVLVVAMIVTVRSRGQFCLPIFSGAGADALAGINPYEVRLGRTDFFKYAPIWAQLLIPLSILSGVISEFGLQCLWWAGNAAAFIGGCWIFVAQSPELWRDLSGARKALIVITVFPLLLANGFYGQINSLLWFLIAIVLSSLRGASPARSVVAGIFLGLAFWMKLFPLAFLVFAVFPATRLSRSAQLQFLGGFLASVVAGLVLPWASWGVETPNIFQSWLQVLAHDLQSPHHKLGLGSLLVSSSREVVRSITVLAFAILAALAWRHRDEQRRRLQEALWMVSFLVFSHMTEPPTLALFAPAAWVFCSNCKKWEAAAFLVLSLVLPSGVLGETWTHAFPGGGYAAKTWAMIAVGISLVFRYSEGSVGASGSGARA